MFASPFGAAYMAQCTDTKRMFGDTTVVRTRLQPPRLPRRWLRRRRLDEKLAEAAEYALTVVHASAGYGKSSVLANFAAHGGWPVAWYSVGEEARDPLVFLLHLVHAFRQQIALGVGERSLALLQANGGAQRSKQALDALLNDLLPALDDETLLVLDDYHLIDEQPDVRALVEQVILRRPPQLHVILATRRWPSLLCLPTLQARGELLTITEHDLAFTPDEIAALFSSEYDQALEEDVAQRLIRQTAGWPIALHLIAQGSHTHRPDLLPQGEDRSAMIAIDEQTRVPTAHSLPPAVRDVLFAYLANDVFHQQPTEVQHFLLRSSVLFELDPLACDHLLRATGSTTMLRDLYRRGLFVLQVDADLYRYHPLFHAFLRHHAQTTLREWTALHHEAAAYYRERGMDEHVLHLLLAIGDDTGVAVELERLAQPWLNSGRSVTLLDWIERLPPPMRESHPRLLIAQGDAARLSDRFDLALQAYTQAERVYASTGDARKQAQALQGQAQVYLDTVRPAPAERLLKQAFKLLPGEEKDARAVIMRLIAENRLNAGRADQAARLYRCADQIDHQASADGALQPRVLLRLGRLNQARAALEQQTSDDLHAMPQRRPAGHREATVMLSLIHALQGNEAEALRYAQQGLDLGRELGSGLLEAIAHIRLGHASQLGAAPDVVAANQHYLQAMALADAFGVRRTKVEAYLGLVLLHGFGGDLLAAQAAAHEGLALAERSGDRWSVALLWTALGAVCVMHRGADAEMWLSQALRQYEECKDTYGQTVVHLWLAIWHQRAGNEEAAAYARRTLALAGQHGYGGLLTRATLFGPRDRMLLVPILLAGRADPQLSRQAQSWLQEGFPAIAADEEIQTYHPGSTLRIQTFGALRIWRGTDEVTQREWTRKKAPALLALLLTNRHRWLLRDQICDWLWPELSPSEADLQFKVTLNALNAALEPARPPRTAPFYIRRRGSAYRFLPLDGMWLDVDEFDARIATARAHIAAGTDDDLQAALTALSVAVGLYSGDYLSEYLYEEWVQAERERWATRFLQAATMLAELLLRRGRSAEAISICDMVLMRDPCWEEAYRVLMRAYAEQGNRPQALAIYERCARHLRTQLDVAPDAETTALYRQLKA